MRVIAGGMKVRDEAGVDVMRTIAGWRGRAGVFEAARGGLMGFSRAFT